MLRAPSLATCLLLFSACGGGGDGLQPGESYLALATSPNRVFHWTPVEGDQVELYVELHDAVSELPTAFQNRFGPAEVEDWVSEAVDAWLGAAEVDYVLELASHAAGQSHAASRAAIQVTFAAAPAGQFRGAVTVFTGAAFHSVSGVEMQIDVPDDAGNYSAASFRSLVHHEMGHALGIIALVEGAGTSHSPFHSDLMFPVAPVQALSEGDRATIAALYAAPPNLLRGDHEGVGESGDPLLPSPVPYLGVPSVGLPSAVFGAAFSLTGGFVPDTVDRLVMSHTVCGG